MRLVKCNYCGSVFPEREINCTSDSLLQCPRCRLVEPGFSYVEVEDDEQADYFGVRHLSGHFAH